MVQNACKRVLIVDDEQGNIEALLDYFSKCGIQTTYVSSLPEAAREICNKQQKNTPFDAVVLDNDFKSYAPGNINYSELEGVDFARILLGLDNYKEKNPVTLFVKKYFGGFAEDIADEYREKVIMFSGSAYRAGKHDKRYRGIPVACKVPDSEGSCCEEGVIALLTERGFDFSESVETLKQFKDTHLLHDGIDYEDMIAQFLSSNGVSEDEISLYRECLAA